MRKTDIRWCTGVLALFFVIAGTAHLAAQIESRRLQGEVDAAKAELQIAAGERENEAEAARQWRAMYQASVIEIAHLKAENEELLRRWEEVSFAYGEVCYETGWTHSGTFRITHYCACPICCGSNSDGITATGTVATEGRTIAVDPDVIPLGSRVRINGTVYIAEDTGVTGNVIDLFVNDHDQAEAMGTYLTDVSWR